MIDRYVTSDMTEDTAQQVVIMARTASWKEGVQVHWHEPDEFCEARFPHHIFINGHANVGGGGQA